MLTPHPLKLADPALLREQCFIDGAWLGAAADPVVNPATGRVLARVPDLGVAETTLAIEAAERAFKPWSKKLAKERAVILRKWFDLMIAHRDDLALILTSEQGKPLAEALAFGIVGVNSGLISTEVAPFGGVKQSGLGREGSRHGAEEFVELKYVLMAGI